VSLDGKGWGVWAVGVTLLRGHASCLLCGSCCFRPGLARKAASLVVTNDPSGSPRSLRDIPALISHSWSEVSGPAAEGRGRTDGRAAGRLPVSGSRLPFPRARAAGEEGASQSPESWNCSRPSHRLLLPHPRGERSFPLRSVG